MFEWTAITQIAPTDAMRGGGNVQLLILNISLDEIYNCVVSVCFFFFQAEDGIRDLTVTGVQTCALPISLVLPVAGGLALWERTREREGPPPGASGRAAARSPLPLMVLAGVLLCLHFWSWIASLRYTAVASSVVLVSLKSVFAWVIAALWLRERPT